MKQKPKFKVGDKAEIIDDLIFPPKCSPVIDEADIHFWERLMRNTDDKMKQKPKFKVGDKVKITNDFIFRPELKVGDVGVIKTVEPLLFPNYTIIFNKNGKTYTQSSGERHLDFANPEAENTNVEESASIKK